MHIRNAFTRKIMIHKSMIRKTTVRKTMLFGKSILGLLLLSALSAGAQLTPNKPSTGNLFHRPSAPAQVQGPSRVDEFIVDGKLRLSLENAVLLTLLNNSDLSVNRAQFDLSQFAGGLPPRSNANWLLISMALGELSAVPIARSR